MSPQKARKPAFLFIGLFSLVGLLALLDAPSANASSVTFKVCKDTYASSTAPTENFGSTVRWSAQNKRPEARQGFIGFCNVSVPAGAVVTSAKVEVYSLAAQLDANKDVELHLIPNVTNWDEKTLTWANKPAAQSAILATQSGWANHKWISFDATAAVKANGAGNISFEFSTQANEWLGFDSKESNRNPARLVISIASPTTSTTGTTGTTVKSTTTTSTGPTTTTTTAPSATTTTVKPTTTTTPGVTTPPPVGGAGMKVAAVGDVQPPSDSAATRSTAALASQADFILGLGDYQYSDGSLANYNAYFDKSWGPNVFKMYPVLAPTHDDFWGGGALAYWQGGGASGYKPPVAMQQHTSYSFDKGTWHFLAIDDSCYRDTANCDPAKMEAWVRADLAAHPNQCTLAYWHQPYWTSLTASHGRETSMKTITQYLYDAHVDVVLNGHQHGYERFYPQNMSDQRDDAHGIQSFIVGTGGVGHYPWTSTAANSVVHQASDFGVLMMNLKDGSYDWNFVPAAGFTFTDSGSMSCR